jgi:hypothetical protein
MFFSLGSSNQLHSEEKLFSIMFFPNLDRNSIANEIHRENLQMKYKIKTVLI